MNRRIQLDEIFCTNTCLHNFLNPIQYQGRSRSHGFLCFLRSWYCLNQLAWIHKMSFARWRHFITASESEWGYPRAVLGLEQGLTILLFIWPNGPFFSASFRSSSFFLIIHVRDLAMGAISSPTCAGPDQPLRPEAFMCYQLRSGEKVKTGKIFLFKFLFYDISCNSTRQQMKKNKVTH